MLDLDLSGRVAVVTGGASGIGAASARLLAEAGARVAAWDLRHEDRGRGAILSVRADVTDPDAVARAAEETEAAVGPPDILVNCAGAAGPTRPLLELSLEDWRAIHALNLDSVFLVTRRLLPAMAARGWGRVVSLASIAAKEGNANAGAYSSAKAGVVALTKAWGKEVAGTGVLVNCIAPAAVETPFFDTIPDAHRAAVLSKIPLGRFGRAEEIAALALFLCSPACSFSTGAVWDASGGRATY
jgi:3-oxoacyl-[acyl-carrier protein] reductase